MSRVLGHLNTHTHPHSHSKKLYVYYMKSMYIKIESIKYTDIEATTICFIHSTFNEKKKIHTTLKFYMYIKCQDMQSVEKQGKK